VRVTFLSPHLCIAGGVRAILGYAAGLAGRGHEVEVVVPAGGWVRAAQCRLTGAGPDWIGDFPARVRWVPHWQADQLADGDALVATAWQSVPVVAAAADRCGRKFYLVQHYESLYHGQADAVDATYRLPLQKIVISTWLRDVMRERFACDTEVLVTPVDPKIFHPVPAGAATSRPLRVLMLHHEYAWKGVADGLTAVAHARRRHPGLQLVGFGVKPPLQDGLYDEFHANPRQDRLAEIYSSCEIYLCPSWDEGLGMPPMEAMACGAALVTYDNGGCRDYARPEETALVAERRDVDDLAAKLVRMIEDAELRRRLAVAGRTLVTTAWTWPAATERLEKLFADASRR
jgi:glycosyltransferase involved in cell wall biosynthesis